MPPHARIVERDDRPIADLQAAGQFGAADLLVRLESVLGTAREFWYHKNTLLKWMIIILALLVLDRLLSHSPQILAIVAKLL
jgi:hypothetical protein